MVVDATDAASLVGRGEELGFVERALSARPGGGAVMIGAGGVGKTRLAREIVERFSSGRGREVVWVSGTRSARGVPFIQSAPVDATNNFPANTGDVPTGWFGRWRNSDATITRTLLVYVICAAP